MKFRALEKNQLYSTSANQIGTQNSFPLQRAVQENKEEREKQALSERRLQEMPKKKGSSFKLFGKSKDQEVDLRKELEARSRSKVIDVASLERRRDTRTASSPEQHDFRHLLRQTDHSKPVNQTGPRTGSETHQPGFTQPRKVVQHTNGSQDSDYETQF